MWRLTEGQKDLLQPRKVDYVQNFKTYIKQILPQMERSIEVDLLKRYFSIIQNPEVQESMIQAYIRRIVQIKALELSEEQSNLQVEEITGKQDYVTRNVYSPVPLHHLSEWQMGLVQSLTYDHFKKTFLHKSPGDFKNNHIVYSKNFSLLLTEEGVKMCDYLSNVLPHPTALDHHDLLHEDNFQKAFWFVKGMLADALKHKRNDKLAERLFATGFVSDSLLMMLVQEC